MSGGLMSLILVHVLGCRSSLYEGEFIANELILHGHEITDDIKSNFNAAVIVTCSVTSEADKKCRQIIRRVKRSLNDKGVLAVCGCWSEKIDPVQAQELGINILTGSRHKNILPGILDGYIKNDCKKFLDLRTEFNNNNHEWEELKISKPVIHSRAFIKIQDGCDHFCTYCIIPFLRGRPVSRPVNNVIEEVKQVISNGAQEIILTGIHLGLYGRDFGGSLADLINALSKLNIKRLRMGSLEPFCLDENLLSALKNCESFCRHLHLPLQSGDDEILKSMRRGYTSCEFIKLCDRARDILGDELHISSDIMIGFPGETEKNFNNTLQTMRDSNFGRVHIFPYSERAGTLAVNFSDKVSEQIKSIRKNQALELGRELLNNYASKFIGHDVKILIENNSKGYTENYIEAVILKELNKINKNEIYTLKAVNMREGVLECVQ